MSRNLKDYLLLFARGVAMGAADVVPGVSGGTVAFITGIYEELIDSLRSIGLVTVVTLVKRGPLAAWQEINGNFLLAVFGGVLLSLFSLANVIEYALATFPILVWSFFWGLVLASVWHLSRQLRPFTAGALLWFGVGVACALAISLLRPVALPGYWYVMTLGGAIAICAMILPGISGSFLLLLLGLYPIFIAALSDLQWLLLCSFAIGAACGLLLFSRVLSWLLHHYHRATLSVLTGFLLGSLNVIWPWKQVVETRIDRHGEAVPVLQENLWPWHYSELVGEPSYIAGAMLAALFGLVLVIGIELLAVTLSDKTAR
ncbi:DUF368 domain-containing protein [Halioxenophilus sp. WMMB6]|uniref:DUF368 domain-containing protein n=1 Tax=Halioxenophilus sp. WMMB6 TaxID=3073815 RepID=UPI00295F4F9E|nr:DUF368 domain-containing protein [Halioxenophilus sp. WMMB6]